MVVSRSMGDALYAPKDHTHKHKWMQELGDDDHTQYRLESADHSHQSTGAEAGQLDHGLAMVAASLLDDDHPQYLKTTDWGGGGGGMFQRIFIPASIGLFYNDADFDVRLRTSRAVAGGNVLIPQGFRKYGTKLQVYV